MNSLSLTAGLVGTMALLGCGFVGHTQTNEPTKLEDTEKVYSVREIAGLIEADPESLRGKSVLLRTYYGDTVPGMGCSDAMIFIDREDSELYARRYARDVTDDERDTIESIPVVYSGPSLSFPREFFPTVHAVFRGHLFDSNLSSCPNGWSYFVIDAKVAELVDDVAPISRVVVVDRGFVIARGKLLSPPYEITLQNHAVRINGVLYSPALEDQVSRVTLHTDKNLVFAFEGLVQSLRSGRLLIYGGNAYRMSVPNADASTLVKRIGEIMAKQGREQDRRRELAKLLGSWVTAPMVNEIIAGWRN